MIPERIRVAALQFFIRPAAGRIAAPSAECIT